MIALYNKIGFPFGVQRKSLKIFKLQSKFGLGLTINSEKISLCVYRNISNRDGTLAWSIIQPVFNTTRLIVITLFQIDSAN